MSHTVDVHYLAALVGGIVTSFAFPTVGWWPLVFVGPTIWIMGLLARPEGGFRSGFVFGLGCYGPLIWWVGEVETTAGVVLILVQATLAGAAGWGIVRLTARSPDWLQWLVVAGVWAVVESVRYRAPLGGFEWGAFGYALSDLESVRASARWIGTSGWTVIVAAAAAGTATCVLVRKWTPLVPVVGALVVGGVGAVAPSLPEGIPVATAIVQGSTPCPFTHCEDERFRTYLQHLDLTSSIPARSVELVVWSEGSTGSFNADPVNTPEVAVAIGGEAARIGAFLLVGGDRPVSETEWINANVLFGPDGQIRGEYRKRHPVPFGEYVPIRSAIEGYFAIRQRVPRDMIRGQRPVVFDLGAYRLGSVISFEGAFARYARQTAGAGAELLVVATNEGSYGYTPASDQLIGMTRMRSAETGLDVVHAAVTGKSTLITDGGFVGETTDLGASLVVEGVVGARTVETLYVRWGEWMMVGSVIAAALSLVVPASRTRLRSRPEISESAPPKPMANA